MHIDLYGLERNLGRIRNFLPNSNGYIALVAADAFGIGIEAAVARLMLSGVDAFAVTNLLEARRVRRIGPGWPVVVLSASIPGEEKIFLSEKITPVISGLDEAARFCEAAKELGGKFAVHMKLPAKDSKMSVPDFNQAKRMLEMLLACPNLFLEAFSVGGAGTGVPEKNEIPDMEFLKFAESQFTGTAPFIHHGDVFDPSCVPNKFNATLRAGLVLFGVSPDSASILKGFVPEPILTLRSSVSHIKTLPEGAFVGYSKTLKLARDSKIALLAAGYGDGLPRNAGGRSNVIIRDTLAPIAGIVSMDQAAVDITDIPDVELNDDALIIGKSANHAISLEEYCARLSLSPAEALTAITQRVPRFYTQSNV